MLGIREGIREEKRREEYVKNKMYQIIIFLINFTNSSKTYYGNKNAPDVINSTISWLVTVLPPLLHIYVFHFNYPNNWKKYHSSENSFNQIQWKFVTYPFLLCLHVLEYLIKKNWLQEYILWTTIDYIRKQRNITCRLLFTLLK